jgi:uncharacterized protein
VRDLMASKKNLNPKKLCSCSEHNPKDFTEISNMAILQKPFWAEKFLAKLAIYIVKFYQATFSYFLGGHCRFYPSCSHYALESFQTHTVATATKLTIKRLLKCHPLFPQHGYDPVPKSHEGNL